MKENKSTYEKQMKIKEEQGEQLSKKNLDNAVGCFIGGNKMEKKLEAFDEKFNDKIGSSFECSDAEGILEEFKQFLTDTVRECVLDVNGKWAVSVKREKEDTEKNKLCNLMNEYMEAGHNLHRKDCIDRALNNWGIDLLIND